MAADLSGRAFVSARLKLERAKDLSAALLNDMHAFGQRWPFHYTEERLNKDRLYNCFINFREKPAFEKWALMLGDTLHNARCVLDHAVYGMAIAETGKARPPDGGSLAYPFTQTPEQFGELAVDKRYLIHIPRHVVAEIERRQPYHGEVGQRVPI